MIPYDVSTTTAGNTSPSEPMPSAGGDQEAGSVSSPSSADHLSFITSTQRNSSASPLCFGARKLLRRSRAHVPETKQQEEAAPPKGDVVGRYLRKISRRLRKARAAAVKEPRGAVDDTARERAEAVASAVAYCNESLRRGASTATARLVPSPSLHCWLRGWHELDDAASAGEYGEPARPPPRQDGWLLERQARVALRHDLPRPRCR